jgi:hypothetical protein
MLKACLMAGLPQAYSSSHPTTPVPPPAALQRPPVPRRLAGRVAHVSGLRAVAGVNEHLLGGSNPACAALVSGSEPNAQRVNRSLSGFKLGTTILRSLCVFPSTNNIPREEFFLWGFTYESGA